VRSVTIPPPRENDLLTAKVIGFAIEVHRTVGPGLLELAYEECLCFELRQNALLFRQQVYLSIIYKSVKLDCGYRLDIVIEDRIIVELKTVASHCLTGHFFERRVLGISRAPY
jgi:GxxExxY protein